MDGESKGTLTMDEVPHPLRLVLSPHFPEGKWEAREVRGLPRSHSRAGPVTETAAEIRSRARWWWWETAGRKPLNPCSAMFQHLAGPGQTPPSSHVFLPSLAGCREPPSPGPRGGCPCGRGGWEWGRRRAQLYLPSAPQQVKGKGQLKGNPEVGRQFSEPGSGLPWEEEVP